MSMCEKCRFWTPPECAHLGAPGIRGYKKGQKFQRTFSICLFYSMLWVIKYEIITPVTLSFYSTPPQLGRKDIVLIDRKSVV